MVYAPLGLSVLFGRYASAPTVRVAVGVNGVQLVNASLSSVVLTGSTLRVELTPTGRLTGARQCDVVEPNVAVFVCVTCTCQLVQPCSSCRCH